MSPTAYRTAFRALRTEFYPGMSLARALAHEIAARLRNVPQVFVQVRFGPATVKHRILDVVHPWGDQRA